MKKAKACKTFWVRIHQPFFRTFLVLFSRFLGVPHSPVVKCLTRNPGVLRLSRTGSFGFFCGSVLGQDTSEPSLVLVKPRKDMNNVSCHRDMTEILLKAA